LSRWRACVRSPWVIAGLLIVLAMMVRTGCSGASALEEGRARLEAGDETMAAHHFREALAWYLPVAPWREDAADALWAMYERQAEAGRLQEAVQSLSMLRSGILAGRSIVSPDTTLREKVEEHLAPLMARWEAQAAAREGRQHPGPLAEREVHFAEILSQDTLPHRGFGLLALFGFVLWLVMAWRATSAEGRERFKRLGFAAVGFILFLIGLSQA
jgi:hypothetical protein